MQTQITLIGKYIAGFLLILFTALAITSLMAIWPDKMPELGKGDNAWYTSKLFQFELIENNDLNKIDSLNLVLDDCRVHLKNADSVKMVTLQDSIKKIKVLKSTFDVIDKDSKSKKIHLNTILLLLVAIMGFLGNMVHVASSFTSFVGNGEFKRSWILWYFVKPFTASALAVIIYFIIRAGFLNYGSDASNISLYGILTLAAMAGLFTDNATLKLKEIFEVIFKPKDERKDKLNNTDIPKPIPQNSAIDIIPKKIKKGEITKFTVTGINLTQDNVEIQIDGKVIDAITSSTEFSYQFESKDQTFLDLKIINEKNKLVLYSSKIEIVQL